MADEYCMLVVHANQSSIPHPHKTAANSALMPHLLYPALKSVLNASSRLVYCKFST